MKQKVNWLHVSVFYLIACAISWPFFWWRDMEPESWKSWQMIGFLKTASYMWGPGISAIVCFIIFRKTHVKTITFFGTSTLKSLLAWFLPVIALSVFVLKGEEALLIPVLGFWMILGEELGWRGFLEDALRPLSPLKRAILVGFLWEIWHFTNRMHLGTLGEILTRVSIFMIFTILISYVMGWLLSRTFSLTIAVTLHAWIDILAENPQPATFIILGVSLIFWILLIWKWDRPIITLPLKKG